MSEQVAAGIEAFVRRQFSISPTDPRFGRSAPLFDLGYVDSLGVVELLTFIEAEFGVRIPDEELMSDEFTAIDGIAVVVGRLLKASSSTAASIPDGRR
jgi:acyl carrier protein